MWDNLLTWWQPRNRPLNGTSWMLSLKRLLKTTFVGTKQGFYTIKGALSVLCAWAWPIFKVPLQPKTNFPLFSSSWRFDLPWESGKLLCAQWKSDFKQWTRNTLVANSGLMLTFSKIQCWSAKHPAHIDRDVTYSAFFLIFFSS